MKNNRRKIDILQWNAWSLYNKKGEIENIIAKYKLHILIILETWHKPNTNINMQGYKTIRVDRTDNYGGILMWIHN